MTFDQVIVVSAIAAASSSVAALALALLQKARRREVIHVSVKGTSFRVEGADPAEVEAALAELKRKRPARVRVPAETA